MGLVGRGNGVCREIGEALAFAATGMWRPVPLTTGELAKEVAFHDESQVPPEVARRSKWRTSVAKKSVPDD